MPKAATRNGAATRKPSARRAKPAQAAPLARAAAPAHRNLDAGEATLELDAVFTSVARYFSLLSEATRLKILHAICASEQSVSSIVSATGATQTNVSRHLALLHQAGVVARRREGSVVYYRVNDPEIVSICRTVCLQIAGRLDEGRPLRDELIDFASRD